MSILLLVGLLACVLAAFTDLSKGTIPNALTYPLLLASPFAHAILALVNGEPVSGALAATGTSLLGLALCSLVPLFMWRKNAIGGGDVKLFAALGALLGPTLGFEVELYVFVVAALIAPAKLAYDGALLRSLRNVGSQVANVARKKDQRRALDPALVSWFRLGPCFALGFAVELVLRWRSL